MESRNAPGDGGQRLMHAFARCPAHHVVAVKRGRQRYRGEEILCEHRAEGAQFIQSEIAQFHAFFKTKADSVTNDLVRGAEGNALVDQVRGCGHRIQVAGLRGLRGRLNWRAAVKRATSVSIGATKLTEKAGS